MDFEFDPQKSELNKTKHGIDFEEAQAIWTDVASIQLNTNLGEEDRFLAIGLIGEALWTAVITHRGNSIRIISVRRSRKDEKKAYDNCRRI
ncbi:MAG TPA: BrnT family toxin [Pyrinomonadaceae bacterium]|nr:BrnT family toxin [Pyrinomonadaceae bacterium]HMP66626.1 BrnT family toxin [Pyrinomonadaceae bacterium]